MSGRRIARLELENFKGFGERVDLNFDADLVLLVGANGRGKTSTIEALEYIVTGSIGLRVGDENEFNDIDLVHHDRIKGERRTGAKVKVTWKGDASSDVVTISADSDAKSESVETNGLMVDLRKGLQEIEVELVRACTFLYADSLGSLAGLEFSKRRDMVDFFIPDFPRLSALVDDESVFVLKEIESARSQISAIVAETERLNKLEIDAAVAAQDSLDFLKKNFQFVAKNRKVLLSNPGKNIGNVCSLLEIQGVNDDEYAHALDGISEAAEKRIKQLEEERDAKVETDSKHRRVWMRVQNAVRALARVPNGERFLMNSMALKNLRERVGAKEDMLERHSRLQMELGSKKADLHLLWHQKKIDEASKTSSTVDVGWLPVLVTLARLDGETILPKWWEASGLPRPDPSRFEPFLLEEIRRWTTLLSEESELEQQLEDLKARLQDAEVLQKVQPLVDELEVAWVEAGQTSSPPSRADGFLLIDEINQRTVNELAGIPHNDLDYNHEIDNWHRVSKAFSAWSAARNQVREGAQDESVRDRVEQALAKLKQLEELVKFISPSQRRKGFSDALKAYIAENEYGTVINSSLRQVLRWYAHRGDIASGSRVGFSREGPLQVKVGPETGHSTGIASLSRSQLTSIAFGLAMIANLGHASLPTDFLCLDDVSDAFDLDNLAADAAMLRLLAYGENRDGSIGRRQLVLTNHNDELTERIVPLLLPPAGRRMLVIEFLDDGPDKPIRARQWLVQGEKSSRWDGRSPLRALLPEKPSER